MFPFLRILQSTQFTVVFYNPLSSLPTSQGAVRKPEFPLHWPGHIAHPDGIWLFPDAEQLHCKPSRSASRSTLLGKQVLFFHFRSHRRLFSGKHSHLSVL